MKRTSIRADARDIAVRLLPLGEQSFKLAQALNSARFAAFQPYQRFIESFSNDAAHLDLHRKCIVENAKLHLAAAALQPEVYESELLADLRRKAATSPLHHDAATEWIPRIHFDPCEQNACVMKVR